MTFPTRHVGIIRNHCKDPVIKQPGFSGKQDLFFLAWLISQFFNMVYICREICKPNNLSEKKHADFGTDGFLDPPGGYPGSKFYMFSSRHVFWQLFSCC